MSTRKITKSKDLVNSTALAVVQAPHNAPAPPVLRITRCDPRSLKPRARNPRTHDAKQLKQIEHSIRAFGFNRAVLIDSANVIIAGHACVEVAVSLGIPEVPTLCIDHLTPAQIRAFVIAENRLAEQAGWDRKLLALELQELSVELNFDVTVTGFETAEVDLLIGELNDSASDADDEILPIERTEPPVSRVGDLWRIDRHFVFCGDALKKQSYLTLLGSEKAQLVFIDPPYNVKIDGHVSGLGKTKHREFAMASGEMTSRQHRRFLRKAFSHLVAFSIDGAIHYVCMDWRHAHDLLEAAHKPYTELKNLCVWVKDNGGMGSLYRSQHELVFVFKKGSASHINNIELGRFGRSRTNVWRYAGMNGFGKDRDTNLAMHPTPKPTRLISDAILDCSKRNGIVLDAFAGSGATLIAAEQTGRRGLGIEIDPHYVDAIIRRFEDVCGLKAVHEQSQLDFATLRARRRSGDSQ